VNEPAILVVEDEFIIRFAVSDALRDAGFRILEAGSGEEGLTILLSGQVIDLLVTDVRMPGEIDGMELARRSKSLNPALPVIVCSGHLLQEEAKPADGFLAKPYSVDALIKIINELIENPCQNTKPPRIP
jgi:CheY-like chemotaxis protein